MSYENFPTPAEVAPEFYAPPALDEKWEESVMDEIAKYLFNNKKKLHERRQIRFIPAGRRDMGKALEQWKHYSGRIGDLVRESGWVVEHIHSNTLPTLLISLPGIERPKR